MRTLNCVMPPVKRSRPYATRARKARGQLTKWDKRRYIQRSTASFSTAKKALLGVSRLTRMIETKESSRRSPANVSLFHNAVYVVQDTVTTSNMNPFVMEYGTGDPMSTGGQRVGDRVSIRGLMIQMFLENALSRPKVYYRFMVIRAAKGDVPTRATLFKGCSDNKMIDQINTERFSIVATKRFNIHTGNTGPTGVAVTGAPAGETGGGQGTKVLKLWIPGRKFGHGGNVQFENGSTQVKFYDYYLVFMTYDWFGTPQDANAVGKINELYTKLYFKDA